jgi:hypothetical protein
MKTLLFPLALFTLLCACNSPVKEQTDYTSVSTVSSGKPLNVMLTAYAR